MKAIAIIKIAGKGTRINSNTPKQYIEVNGRPIFIYTLMPFNNCKLIDAICLVCDRDHMEYVKEQCQKYALTKVNYFCFGGNNGNASTFNGFNAIMNELDDEDVIVSHDGVRALVTEELIEESIKTAMKGGAAIAAYQTSGNVLFKDNDSKYMGRENILIAQTPISVKKTIMTKCFEFFKNQNENTQNKYAGLDDIVFSLGFSMLKSKGDSLNFKITTNNDLIMFKALAEIKK